MDNTYIAVIGGKNLSAPAEKMASLIGYHLIDAGCSLITDGKTGAAEAADRGAFEACRQKRVEPNERIFSYVPKGTQPKFQNCAWISESKNHLKTKISMIRNTWGAILVGGGNETILQIRLAVLQAIVEGYNFIPVSGQAGKRIGFAPRYRRLKKIFLMIRCLPP